MQADTEFCFLLWRLCRTMNEPFSFHCMCNANHVQYFLTQEWERFHQDHDSASVWTLPAVRRDLNLLRHWIISPSDHFPHSLTVHCPCQWHELLQKTFLDAAIFERCSPPAGQVLRNLEQQPPDLLRSQYFWGIDFKRSTLSKGYILLPPGLGNWEVLHSLF